MSAVIISVYVLSRRKQRFDVVVSLLVLVLMWPVMMIIGLVIWMTSGWPVLFAQERGGREGKRFVMYKFRTMYVGAEDDQYLYVDRNEADGPVFKIRNDPRYAGVGRWLGRAETITGG